MILFSISKGKMPTRENNAGSPSISGQLRRTGMYYSYMLGAAPPDGGVQGAVADSQAGLNCRKSPISAHGGLVHAHRQH